MAKKRVTKKQQQQKKQQQMLLMAGGAVVAVILAAVVILLVQREADVDVCEASDEDCYGTYLLIEDRGLTDDFIPYIGSEDAPVIIAEFSDFSCSYCLEFHPTAKGIINDFVSTGQARFEYRPMDGVRPPYSQTAAVAALCAGEQGAFWQFHDELFELAAAESPEAFEQDRMVDMADAMGLEADQFERCTNSGRPREATSKTDNMARRLQITGTPSIAYSLDNGATWTLLESRSYQAISAVIASANSGG